MLKLEIIDNALVVTNLESNLVQEDVPAHSVYGRLEGDRAIIYDRYRTRRGYHHREVLNVKLADLQDSEGTTFIEQTFRAFYRANLGLGPAR